MQNIFTLEQRNEDCLFGLSFKVARLDKSMIQIPFIMGYVVGLGLQNPELKIFISIGHSVAEILNVPSPGNQQLWQQLSFYFLHFCQSPVANMAANYICIKHKTKVYGEMR